jgi:hypothetical protein
MSTAAPGAARGAFTAVVAELRQCAAVRDSRAMCHAFLTLAQLLEQLDGAASISVALQTASADAGALEAVVEAMHALPHVCAVQRNAAATIHAIALDNEATQAHAVRARALEPLLCALSAHGDDAGALMCVLNALGEVVLDPCGAARAARADVPACVAAAMRTRASDAGVVRRGVTVLSNIICWRHARELTWWPRSEHTRVAAEFASALVGALVAHPSDLEMVGHALRALFFVHVRLCEAGDACARSAASAFAAAAVTAGARTEQVQLALRVAAVASEDLELRAAELRAWLRDADADAAGVAPERTQRQHVASKAVVRVVELSSRGAPPQLCEALVALTAAAPGAPGAARACVLAGGVPAVLALLDTPPADDAMRCASLRALSALAVDPSGRLHAAREQAGVTACMAALRNTPQRRSAAVAAAALDALARLTECGCASNARAAHTQGVLTLAPPLLALHGEHDAGVAAGVCAALAHVVALDDDGVRTSVAVCAGVLQASACTVLHLAQQRAGGGDADAACWRNASAAACALVRSVYTQSSGAASMAASLGRAGVMLVLRALRAHAAACATSARCGCAALHALCGGDSGGASSGSADLVALAHRDGAADAVVAAMGQHAHDIRVQLAGVCALDALARSGAAAWVENGGGAAAAARAVVTAMHCPPVGEDDDDDDADTDAQHLARRGAHALLLLLRFEALPGAEATAAAAVRAGGIEALIAALHTYGEDAACVAEPALRALHALMREPDAEARRERAAGAGAASAVACAWRAFTVDGVARLEQRCAATRTAFRELTAWFPFENRSGAAVMPAVRGRRAGAAAGEAVGAAPPAAKMVCAAGCGAAQQRGAPAFKLCAACRSARYCSVACQHAHWRVHKAECRATAGAAAATGRR